jgi:hypothetical protein
MKAKSKHKIAKENSTTYESLRRIQRGLAENPTLKNLLAYSKIYSIDIHIVKGEITYQKNI